MWPTSIDFTGSQRWQAVDGPYQSPCSAGCQRQHALWEQQRRRQWNPNAAVVQKCSWLVALEVEFKGYQQTFRCSEVSERYGIFHLWTNTPSQLTSIFSISAASLHCYGLNMFKSLAEEIWRKRCICKFFPYFVYPEDQRLWSGPFYVAVHWWTAPAETFVRTFLRLWFYRGSWLQYLQIN